MHILREFNISSRMWILVALLIIGISAIVTLSLFHLKADLTKEKSVQTQHLVESVHSIVVNYYNLASQGKMDMAAAKQAAKDAIKSMRYGNNNYFFINDMQPVMVMHPIKPSLIGKSLANLKDPTGKAFVMEMVRIVSEKGEGTVPYLWAKPGEEQPVPKITYVKGFKPWGWIVGSGIYIDDVDAYFWQSATQLLGMGLIITIPVLIIALLIARSIGCPIQETTRAMRAIAEGESDLSQRLDSNGKDEVSKLATAFNQFVYKLQQIMLELENSANDVAHTSTDLSTVTIEESKGIEEQNIQTEHVAAAVTEMSATIQEIAKNAEGAAASAIDADREAHASEQKMNQTNQAIDTLAKEVNVAAEVINQLKQDSDNIGSVLGVIQGIAEQTNLLALNAAIEAARAGEQGRGFAVVADEVRTLASKTKESTQEIQEMIDRLQNGTQKAVDVMENSHQTTSATIESASTAAESLQKIVQSINTISDMNTQIASAAEQQSAVAQGIEQNVCRISTLAEKSSKGSETVMNIANNLSDYGKELRTQISTFKIK